MTDICAPLPGKRPGEAHLSVLNRNQKTYVDIHTPPPPNIYAHCVVNMPTTLEGTLLYFHPRQFAAQCWLHSIVLRSTPPDRAPQWAQLAEEPDALLHGLEDVVDLGLGRKPANAEADARVGASSLLPQRPHT